MRYILMIFLLFFPFNVIACPITDEIKVSLQIQKENLYPLCHTGYFALYSADTKTSVYVAEIVLKENLADTIKRKNTFKPDPLLPKEVASQLSDYEKSSYARGHLAPADNQSTSRQAMNETFYLSNMVPQVQNCNNNGVWKNIEIKARKLAERYDKVLVVTGPIYHGDEPVIGNNVKVPSTLFKVIFVPTINETYAYIVPNAPFCGADYNAFAVPKDKVEQQTNLKIFE